jgi:Protein of unknown function (DUF4239)
VVWLTSLPVGLLVLGSLAFALLIAGASRLVIAAIVPSGEREHVQAIAAPLMPALGATFAVLTALTLASENTYLRSAQDVVSKEAADASRLAWASTTPGVDSEPTQAALLDYLQATRANEWHGANSAESADPATTRAIATLERVVRAEATHPELGTPTSSELLASLDAVTVGRRTRIAAAARQLPVLYVVTLVASGVALVSNAGALTFRSTARTSLLIVGLACIVGLSVALLFALSAPWDGPLVVSGHPIDRMVQDLQTGYFTP